MGGRKGGDKQLINDEAREKLGKLADLFAHKPAEQSEVHEMVENAIAEHGNPPPVDIMVAIYEKLDPAEELQFWDALQELCGNAYASSVADAATKAEQAEKGEDKNDQHDEESA